MLNRSSKIFFTIFSLLLTLSILLTFYSKIIIARFPIFTTQEEIDAARLINF